jgi:hypothetical protein
MSPTGSGGGLALGINVSLSSRKCVLIHHSDREERRVKKQEWGVMYQFEIIPFVNMRTLPLAEALRVAPSRLSGTFSWPEA